MIIELDDVPVGFLGEGNWEAVEYSLQRFKPKAEGRACGFTRRADYGELTPSQYWNLTYRRRVASDPEWAKARKATARRSRKKAGSRWAKMTEAQKAAARKRSRECRARRRATGLPSRPSA